MVSAATATAVNEHKDVGLFTEAEAGRLRMPDGYKRSIATWYAMPGIHVT